MLFPWARYFICIVSVDSAVKWVPGGDNLVKDVQCYELFGGIAPKNHAFSLQSKDDLLENLFTTDQISFAFVSFINKVQLDFGSVAKNYELCKVILLYVIIIILCIFTLLYILVCYLVICVAKFEPMLVKNALKPSVV